MNRRDIKNRIAFQIRTSVPGEERYKIGAVGQILETIRYIPFRDDSIMRGQSLVSVTGHWRILSYIYIYTYIYIHT